MDKNLKFTEWCETCVSDATIKITKNHLIKRKGVINCTNCKAVILACAMCKGDKCKDCNTTNSKFEWWYE